jgi:protein-tyrosine-phosphatase
MICFEELPITIDQRLCKEIDGKIWNSDVKKDVTISNLLEVWDIDDPYETSEMAQVLRHLKRICDLYNEACEELDMHNSQY